VEDYHDIASGHHHIDDDTIVKTIIDTTIKKISLDISMTILLLVNVFNRCIYTNAPRVRMQF
jgi:hypothetical protein